MRASNAVTALALGVSVIMIGTSGVAAAADQLRTRTQDRLRDGSCEVSAIRARDRDRLKDGSCLVTMKRARIRLNDGTGSGPLHTRDRLHDGTCTTS